MPNLKQPLSLLSITRDKVLQILISKSEGGEVGWVEVAAELIPPSCADYFVEKVIEHCLTTECDNHGNFSSLFNSKVKQIRTKTKYLKDPENILDVFKNLSKCEFLQQIDISAEICLKIPKILQEFVINFPCIETDRKSVV